MNIPFFNKKKDPLLEDEKIFQQEALDIKDIIAPAYIGITQDNITLGDRISKTFFIFSYPRYLNTGWLSPAINLSLPMDISFFIHPISNESILKKLRSKITQVSSELMERQEKGLIRDPALETGYQDIENLRDKIITAQEKMFRFGLYITIYQKNRRANERSRNSIKIYF